MKNSIEDIAESKLIILYLLDQAACPLTNIQMTRLLYDFEEFNYYYFQHVLSELINQNYILNYERETDWLYEITPEGHEILALTENMLPGIVKHKINMILNDMLSTLKNEISITAEYIPEGQNEYSTKCKITEVHKTLFEVNVLCTSQEQAKKIADNWKKDASNIYPEIVKILTK